MADLTIAAANVVAGSGAQVERGTAGAAVTAGQAVYYDAADARYKLADNNAVAAAARSPRGIALHGASAGQPLAVLSGGDIMLGAVLTAGTAYFLSDTPGGLCPAADIGSGEYACFIGIAKTTSALAVNITNSGAAL